MITPVHSGKFKSTLPGMKSHMGRNQKPTRVGSRAHHAQNQARRGEMLNQVAKMRSPAQLQAIGQRTARRHPMANSDSVYPYQDVSPTNKQEEAVYRPSNKQLGALWTWTNGIFNTKYYVDVDKVQEILGNNYIKEKLSKLMRLIFSDKFTITILDPQGDPDEELCAYYTRMMDAPQVNLWSKMQISWYDMFAWGISIFNPVWGRVDHDGNPDPSGPDIGLIKLRHLPAESFGKGTSLSRYSDLLQGIILNEETQEVEYWQRPRYFDMPQQVTDPFVVKDPTTAGIAGESMIVPIIPLVNDLAFAWKCVLQQANRIGAPTMFMQVKEPVTQTETENDYDWADQVVSEWGKDTGFTIKENMTPIPLNITETDVGQKIIETLTQRLDDYFNPATFLKKGKMGAGLSDGAGSEKEMIEDWVRGIHNMLEEMWAQLVQHALDANGYGAKGYRVQIEIPISTGDRSQVDIARAQAAYTCKCATTNELRQFLTLPELDDQGLEDLREDVKASTPAPPPIMLPGMQNPQGDGQEGPQNGQEAKGPKEQVNIPTKKGEAPDAQETAKEKVPKGKAQNQGPSIKKRADPLEEEIGHLYDTLEDGIFQILRKAKA